MNPALPRTKVLHHYVQRYLRETGTKQQGWAHTVAERYVERTPLEHRSVQFHFGGDADKDAKANRQIIERMFDPDESVRFPADLEEAVVFSLPPAWRTGLLSDLAARYDLLTAQIPHAGEAPSADWCARAGRLMTEAGQALEALAPVVADGSIDEDDCRDELREALRQQRELQSLSVEITAALQQALFERRARDHQTTVKVVK